MSHRNEDDNLHISRNGVLSIDTDELRAVVSQLDPSIASLRSAGYKLNMAANITADANFRIKTGVLSRQIGEQAEEIAAIRANVKEMVRVFEYIEEKLAGMTPQEVWAQVEWWNPLWLLGTLAPTTTEGRANQFLLERHRDSSRGFIESTNWSWGLGFGALPYTVAIAAAFPLIVGAIGKGVVDSTTTLKPRNRSSAFKVVPDEEPMAAPTNLTESFDHYPTKDDAQVRVEEYVMADGTTEFVVYIGGTQALTGEPFDMLSNTDLYLDQEESASYAAVVNALKAAGVEPDDPVHVNGHSQGAAIGSHLAAGGEFNVVTNISLGGPVNVEVPDDVTSWVLQHTNDPVALLASGGIGLGSGSDDSRVIQAEGVPVLGIALPLTTHVLGSYQITAEKLDALQSDDLQAMRDHFARFETAKPVKATEYVAVF